MNIVDSSLWVEYFLGNDIDLAIIDAVRDTKHLLVPSICLYEVHKKFLSADDVGKAELAVEIMQNAVVVGMTPSDSDPRGKTWKAAQTPDGGQYYLRDSPPP